MLRGERLLVLVVHWRTRTSCDPLQGCPAWLTAAVLFGPLPSPYLAVLIPPTPSGPYCPLPMWVRDLHYTPPSPHLLLTSAGS